MIFVNIGSVIVNKTSILDKTFEFDIKRA